MSLLLFIPISSNIKLFTYKGTISTEKQGGNFHLDVQQYLNLEVLLYRGLEDLDRLLWLCYAKPQNQWTAVSYY